MSVDLSWGFDVAKDDLKKGGGYEVAISNQCRGIRGWKNSGSADVIAQATATVERWAHTCRDDEIHELARFIFGTRGASAMSLPAAYFRIESTDTSKVPPWRYDKCR